MSKQLLRLLEKLVESVDELPLRQKVQLLTLMLSGTFVTLLAGTVLYSPIFHA